MGRRILLAILTLFAAAVTAQAQGAGRIVGTVSSADGPPLPGIQITVNGTSRGAVSDSGGRFAINDVPAGVHSLLARGIGFAPGTRTVTVVAGQSVTADFSLVSAPAQLSPVVVVGYGTQDRRAVTGAVSTVKAEQ